MVTSTALNPTKTIRIRIKTELLTKRSMSSRIGSIPLAPLSLADGTSLGIPKRHLLVNLCSVGELARSTAWLACETC